MQNNLLGGIGQLNNLFCGKIYTFHVLKIFNQNQLEFSYLIYSASILYD